MGWENLDGGGDLHEHITDFLGGSDRLSMRRVATAHRYDSEWSIAARIRPIAERLGTRALGLNAEVAAYNTVTGPVIAVINHPSRLTFLTVGDALDTSLADLDRESQQASRLLQRLVDPHQPASPTLHGLRIQLQGISNGMGAQRVIVQARRAAVAAAAELPAQNDPMMLL